MSRNKNSSSEARQKFPEQGNMGKSAEIRRHRGFRAGLLDLDAPGDGSGTVPRGQSLEVSPSGAQQCSWCLLTHSSQYPTGTTKNASRCCQMSHGGKSTPCWEPCFLGMALVAQLLNITVGECKWDRRRLSPGCCEVKQRQELWGKWHQGLRLSNVTLGVFLFPPLSFYICKNNNNNNITGVIIMIIRLSRD